MSSRSEGSNYHEDAANRKAEADGGMLQPHPAVTDDHSRFLSANLLDLHDGNSEDRGLSGHRFDSGGAARSTYSLQSRHQQRRAGADRVHEQFQSGLSLPSVLGLQQEMHQQSLLEGHLRTPGGYSSAGELESISQQVPRADLGYAHHDRGFDCILEPSRRWSEPLLTADREAYSETSQPPWEAGIVAPSFFRERSMRDKEIRRLTVWLDVLRGEKATRELEQREAQQQRQNVVLPPAHGTFQTELATRSASPRYTTQTSLDRHQDFSPPPRGHGFETSVNDAISRLKRGEGVPIAQPSDKGLLSDYQLLIRESLSLFQMQESDILLALAPGRKNKPTPGQIGVRCRYCEHAPHHRRGGGAVYFPSGVSSIYQAAQNIAANHLIKTCTDIPSSAKEQLIAARRQLKEQPRRSGGNTYWMETSRHLGLVDREGVKGVWCAH